MFTEKRRSLRRVISRYAKVQVSGGALPRDCLVSDISAGGVRLHVEGIDVPDRFVLFVDDGGGAKPRDCAVVWRLGYELGARFTDVFGMDYTLKDAKPTSAPAST
jgi:hypothetical protein